MNILHKIWTRSLFNSPTLSLTQLSLTPLSTLQNEADKFTFTCIQLADTFTQSDSQLRNNLSTKLSNCNHVGLKNSPKLKKTQKIRVWNPGVTKVQSFGFSCGCADIALCLWGAYLPKAQSSIAPLSSCLFVCLIDFLYLLVFGFVISLSCSHAQLTANVCFQKNSMLKLIVGRI